ncbi:MAG: SDR family NAD(P)-dependent oxidoreductase [Pseudomonadota bacterium]
MSGARPVALVTGASEGIGRAFAEALAEAGWDLRLTARSGERLASLADALAARGARTAWLSADLAAEGAAARVWDWASADGAVPQMLVNSAGLGSYGLVTEADWAREHASIRVNLEALTLLSKRAAVAMAAEGRGRIVTVASTAAFQPCPRMAVYAGTKAYVLSFSEALAEELAGSGVTVTALCPGPVRTPFQDRAEMLDAALIKGRRLPGPEAVARFGLRAALAGRRVAIPGTLNAATAFAVRFLPRRLVTWLALHVMAPRR